MSYKLKNVPELRFPEFVGGVLKQGVLDSFCEINPNTGDLSDTFIYIDLESVNNGRLEKEKKISKENAPSRAQRVLEIGDILYQTVRPYQKNNYFFDKDGDYVASTGYAQIRTNQNRKYFFQYIHTTKFVNNVLKRCTGTSYPAIGTSDLKTIPISIPTPPEQTKIANFLTAVDKCINLLQKKKAELEQYKKGVMQKLFSQTIRFKQDDGNDFPDWEEKKLGEVLTTISTKPYQIKSKDILKKGKYTVIDQGQDKIAGYSNDEKKLLTNKKVIVYGDHTTIVKYVDFNFIVGADGTKILEPKNNDYTLFLYYCLYILNLYGLVNEV